MKKQDKQNNQEKQNYKYVTITLPKELVEKYKLFLKENGYSISKRMAILIEKDLKELKS